MGCLKIDDRLTQRYIRLCSALLLSLLLAGAAACGGAGSRMDGAPLNPAGPGGQLPAPSALRNVSYTPAELVCCGAEFITASGFPQRNAAPVELYCEFTPGWTTAAPNFNQLAYSCYAFDMSGYDRAQQISFGWRQTGDPADLWIGLADFRRDCWSWHRLPEGSDTLALDFTPYIDPVTQRMLVLPLLTGESVWQLDYIHVGDLSSVCGQVWQADGVTPLGDAEVVLAGTQEYSARSDWEGKWLIHGVLPGDYSASAQLIGWQFDPPAREVTVDALKLSVDAFTGTPLPLQDVSGLVVVPPANDPLRGVEIRITRPGSPYGGLSCWTDDLGSWLVQLPDDEYIATPAMAGWEFSPPSREFSVAGAPVVVDTFSGAKLPGYLVDGYVIQSGSGAGIADVQINVFNEPAGLWFYASTDASGYWSCPDVPDGEYACDPIYYGWDFNPPAQTLTVAGSALRAEPFVGTPLSRSTVDGYIYLDDGVTPLPGINLQLVSDSGWYYATTNSSGHYIFEEVCAGEYTAAPTSLSYTFDPIEQTITVAGDLTLEDFLATAQPTYKVDGYVRNEDGVSGVEGVLVTVYCYIPAGTSFEALTGPDGHWEVYTPPGFYTVWPQKQGWTFMPPDWSIQVDNADVTVPVFIGSVLPSYSLSGYVYRQDGTTSLEGVQIDIYGSSYSYKTVTDASGHWQVDEAFEDSYTVRPMLAPWQFTPESRDVTVAGGDVLVEPFIGEELQSWLVDGVIYESGGTTPVPDVEVWFYGPSLVYRALSDASGHYQIPLPAGEWTAQPQSTCWSFDPVEQLFTVGSAPVTLEIFYATPGG